MRKPKVSVNWEEVKLYFVQPTEEQNLLPPWQRQFSVAMLQWPADDLPPQQTLVAKDWTLQDFQCVYDKNNFIWERFWLILCISYKFWDTVLWKNSEVAIGDLVPGLSSFVVNHFCYQTSTSLPSFCLARYYNVLIGKRVNVTIWQKEKGCKRVAMAQ